MQSGSISQAFTKAVARAGIINLHFHDTRHAAITALAKKLTVLELARAIGHKDVRSLMTYYNETAENLAEKLG
jgi:integrase